MKKPEELSAYYEQELLSDLKELDNQRKKTLLLLVAYLFLLAVTAIISLGLLAGLYYASCPCLPCAVVLIPTILLMALALGYHRIKSGYVKGFKEKVMVKIVGFIDSDLTYSYQMHIPRDSYMRSGIFLSNPDLYSGEDYVTGSIDKTRIEFSEIHAQEKHETRDSKGHRHTHYSTIFKGVFFIADFNKNFKGRTLVLPDAAEKLLGSMLGSFLQSKNIMRPPLVKLEDPEFEKYFVVYGEDQVEARYILSTSLMQRITEFRKKTGRKIYLSFVNNNVMIAVPSGRDLFEPRLLRSIVDYGKIEEYYNTMSLFTGIVDDLNLNTRIWGKE
jgi:hypothetical protein